MDLLTHLRIGQRLGLAFAISIAFSVLLAIYDQVTQQNAALVEESAAAAESLRAQARQLAETVSAFKLDAVAAAADDEWTSF